MFSVRYKLSLSLSLFEPTLFLTVTVLYRDQIACSHFRQFPLCSVLLLHSLLRSPGGFHFWSNFFLRQIFIVLFLLHFIALNMQFIYRKCDKVFSNVYWWFHINKKHVKFHEATETVWHIGFREKGKTRERGSRGRCTPLCRWICSWPNRNVKMFFWRKKIVH